MLSLNLTYFKLMPYNLFLNQALPLSTQDQVKTVELIKTFEKNEMATQAVTVHLFEMKTDYSLSLLEAIPSGHSVTFIIGAKSFKMTEAQLT